MISHHLSWLKLKRVFPAAARCDAMISQTSFSSTNPQYLFHRSLYIGASIYEPPYPSGVGFSRPRAFQEAHTCPSGGVCTQVTFAIKSKHWSRPIQAQILLYPLIAVAQRIVRSQIFSQLATMSTPELVAMQCQLQASAEQLQVVLNALDLLCHESGNSIVDLRRLPPRRAIIWRKITESAS